MSTICKKPGESVAMVGRGSLLVWILLFSANISYVIGTIRWTAPSQTSLTFSIIESRDNDYVNIPGNEGFKTNWTEDHVYTASAVFDGTTNSDGIIYLFYTDTVGNEFTTQNTSTFFRIEQNTGKMYRHSNKLDYEESNERTIYVNLIAINRNNPDDNNRKKFLCSVRDFNDNRPKFINDSRQVSVRENTPVGDGGKVLLQNLVMTDKDTVLSAGQGFLNASVQYCIYKERDIVPCNNLFKLQPTALDTKQFTGDFYITDMLDFESNQTIQVQIKVTDGYFDTVTDITVNVIDVQDTPPSWIVLQQVNEVDEETVGWSIRVEAQDQDTGKRDIYYTLRTGQYEGIPISSVFEIDPLTGVITNIARLDLEDENLFRNYGLNGQRKIIRNDWELSIDACEIIDASVNPIEIGTGTENCATPGVIRVQINDINDNAPLHTDGNLYVYYMPEDTPKGADLGKPDISIFDRDTELYNQHRSYFDPPSAEFKVGGTDLGPVIQVENPGLIDYDNGPKMYNLTLITVDKKEKMLNSTAYVTVHITDVNDNRPQFDRTFEQTIPEDSQEGFFVITIDATDADSNDFGTDGIRYELFGAYTDLFAIDAVTGAVTVSRCDTYGVKPCLDYDYAPQTYVLSVRATDSRGNQLTGNSNTVQLRVTLTGVNDNPPTVRDYTRQITEGRTTFDRELIIQGSDIDEGSSLRYELESQSPGRFWAVDPVTGRVYVNKPNGEGIKFTDGDASGKFLLNVRVTDGIYNDVYSRVSITVIDQNDNAPFCIPSNYVKTIDETTPPETYLLTVLCSDTDDPTSENGQLQYRIDPSGNSGAKFAIDLTSGDFSVAGGAAFDAELEARYVMKVIVSDRGQPRLSTSATVTINIRDTNNKDPIVDPFMQEFFVYDNAPIGFQVGALTARDPDVDAQIRFEWHGLKEASSAEGYIVTPDSGYDFTELFTIDYEKGTIRVNKPLDSDKAAIVSYGVRAIDITPAEPQYGPGQVIIYVRPYNDEGPEFDSFNTPIYINEEQPLGSVVISLFAKDDNGILRYQIFNHLDDRYFTIDPTTGSVSILNRIDYDDARRINDTYFTVVAIDRGEPPLSATASVSVIFRNINDIFPEFIDPVRGTPVTRYTVKIPENSPDGTQVVTVFANDRDRPDNNTFNQVRYSMSDNRFEVDPITGQIVVRLLDGFVLDRESNPRINTRVIARDNPISAGSPPKQNQRAASVTILLTDVNDNCPIYSRPEYRSTIFETIGVDTDILQLFSTDRDEKENAASYYSKVYGPGTDYDDFFDVRRESGRIFVKKELVRHTGTYKFYVEATDNLGKGCATNTSVVVRVNPAANAPPVWVIPPVDNMTILVLEEQYKGMLILDIFARDEDSGINGIVEYSFIYNGQTVVATPEFKINRITGVIQAEIIYDRERVDKYVLLLKASDRGDTPLETTRFLTVVILDVNDNKPVFADREFQIDIREDWPVGDIRQIPTATDLDLNPVIFYEIIAGNEDGMFELDSITRMLRLVKELDRENQGIYYLDVQATNVEEDYTVIRSRRRRAIDQSILTLKVVIGDLNDLAPSFLQDEYYGCVSARAPYDKHILTVQAIDRDAVGSGVVRYSVTNGNKIGNVTLFDIHPKFGVITNKVLMRKYADSTFFVTINARDGEDIETAESANTIAKIFVNHPGNEVKLQITQNTGEVRLYQAQIQSILEEAADLSYVCINDIQDHVVDTVGSVSTLWSDVYITGIRREINDGTEQYSILSNTELKNIVNRERFDRKSDFDLLYIREVEAASSSQEIELEDQAVLIILIIIAVLIFLVIIFCIVAFLCIRAAKRQKKALLLHKTHATPLPAIVEPQPVIVEPVVYDNRAYVVEDQQPIVVDEQQVIDYEPVHVQYAVVNKRSPSPQVYEDDQDAIVVELKDDELPVGQPVVYETEPGEVYRIETEVVTDEDRR